MRIITFVLVFTGFGMARISGQDTFSIVAVDPATGEVGSAGASCISKTNLKNFFPNIDPDFLGDLLPGLGAINTQSFYLAQNQVNARNRMLAGDTPQQLMDWLAANDVQGNSTQRQYGAAALINGQAQAAAFTGVNCLDYKGQRTGANYAIQGNILLGAAILDSMEARFLRANGCLSNRLMQAMQGAKVPGADSRCLSNGTSSMFAFIKVAKPNDPVANPSLRLFVSYDPLGIEPIDSLQALYDKQAPCVTSVHEANFLHFSVKTNADSGEITLMAPDAVSPLYLDIFDTQGRCILQNKPVISGQAIALDVFGVLLLRLKDAEGRSGTLKAAMIR